MMEPYHESIRHYVQRLLTEMRTERTSWIRRYRELNDYVQPDSGRFFQTDRDRGLPRNDRIVNNTATTSLRTLSSGMLSGLTSPARPWFQLRTMNPVLNQKKSVKVWLDTVRSRMSDVFLKSNLYTTLPQAYSDLGLFGTTCFAILEDDETVIRCYPFPVGSYMLANDSKGKVDTCVREFMMTRRQLIEKFGYENCSLTTRRCWDEHSALEKWVPVVHAVLPNPDWNQQSILSKHKQFKSIYYENEVSSATPDQLLSEAGFDEFPNMAARWLVVGEDIYGRSPTMDVLGDIKALQLLERRKAQAIDKVVNPPMVAPSSLKHQRVSLLPGDVTYLDSTVGQAFVPAYQIKPDLPALAAEIQIVEQRIRRTLYEDIFMMIADDNRSGVTATEIEERHEEKMLMLGPVLERLNDELLDPLIKRTFSIMRKQGLIPLPPPELRGMDLAIEYVSILAQAQKMLSVGAMEKFMAFSGNMASAHPPVLDKIDFDQALEDYGDMVGVPPQIINDQEQVAKVRAIRDRQQAQQQQMAMAQQGAQTAQTLGQTQVTPDNALGAMISRATGGTPP